MHRSGDRILFSATDVSGFLACPHLTTLEHRHLLGGPDHPTFDDPSVKVLRRRGEEHEDEILEAYRAQDREVAKVGDPDWGGEPDAWAALADETRTLMEAGADVIHQGTFFDGTWLGRPDFLVRVDEPSDLGAWSYEVVDAKLARSSKATAVLQICFYSEMLEAVQGTPPALMHLALGGPDKPRETFRVTDYAAYYRSVKRRFQDAVRPGGGPPTFTGETDRADLPTYPEPCDHCQVCDWQPVCKEQWHEDDHLSLVAGITRRQRAQLEERGAATLEALAELPLPLEPPLESVSPQAFTRIHEQARIQLEGRREDRHLYELLTDVEEGNGLLALPEPSPGDLFFDIEGDSHAFTDGLEYLLGWVDVDERFTGLWALDPTEERARFEEFIDRVVERLDRWPELHIYHYNHYETTAVKKLASRYATREDEVDRLLRGGVFVDLYRVVRQGLRASVESYSIKKLEPLYGYDRAQDLRAASSALANFEAWLQLGGPRATEATSDDASGEEAPDAEALLQEIQDYNEDDCVSTLRLRDWLEERRTELAGILGEALPRPEPPDPDAGEDVQEESERVQALMDALTDGVSDDPAERSEEEQARWILAHLLSWHRREDKSFWWDVFRMRGLDERDLLRDAKTLGGLEYVGVVDQVKRSLVHRYRFPEQDFKLSAGDGVEDPRTEGSPGTVVAVDEAERTLDLKRAKSSDVPHPTALIPFEYINDTVLRQSLQGLGDDVVAHGLDGAENRAAADLLSKRPPRAGQEPGTALRREDETALEAARRLAPRLDGTVLPIQGPPGSGKTYIGARMIVTLLAAGKRVGVTANSHTVIVNLLDEVCAVAREEGVELRGIQKASKKQACTDDAVAFTGANKKVREALAEGEANLAAGTVWLWARPEMAEDGPAVDVLFVDEAGQMSLANVLAASQAADSVVLLGDPQQLEQPQKGVHPPGTGLSALEHLVGERTLASELGLFLEETWRLHPDICAFTSELYYEGLLKSRPELVRQEVRGPAPFDGFGLRFVSVEHEGNASESPEEVEVIRGLVEELLEGGASWVDAEGREKPIGLGEVLVVAPYNAQVGALRAALPEGAQVGTVDKFQGQEAPIVIYSTTTSSADDAPRGMEFIYSPNRFNVATSRARCLAVVVGSPALYTPDCRSVRQMKLANGFCRFGEMAGE